MSFFELQGSERSFLRVKMTPIPHVDTSGGQTSPHVLCNKYKRLAICFYLFFSGPEKFHFSLISTSFTFLFSFATSRLFLDFILFFLYPSLPLAPPFPCPSLYYKCVRLLSLSHLPIGQRKLRGVSCVCSLCFCAHKINYTPCRRSRSSPTSRKT